MELSKLDPPSSLDHLILNDDAAPINPPNSFPEFPTSPSGAPLRTSDESKRLLIGRFFCCISNPVDVKGLLDIVAHAVQIHFASGSCQGKRAVFNHMREEATAQKKYCPTARRLVPTLVVVQGSKAVVRFREEAESCLTSAEYHGFAEFEFEEFGTGEPLPPVPTAHSNSALYGISPVPVIAETEGKELLAAAPAPPTPCGSAIPAIPSLPQSETPTARAAPLLLASVTLGGPHLMARGAAPTLATPSVGEALGDLDEHERDASHMPLSPSTLRVLALTRQPSATLLLCNYRISKVAVKYSYRPSCLERALRFLCCCRHFEPLSEEIIH